MNNFKPLILLAAALLPVMLKAQITEITFGEVPKADVEMTGYEPDPGADAVILDDYGNVYFEDNSKIEIVVEHHTRIKIINSNGFDYGDFKLIYRNTDKIEKLQAATYNIENGEVKKELLNKKNIYYGDASKTRKSISFTFPNVREGSLLEIKYTQRSENYFFLCPWQIQKEIPVRYGNFKISVPGYFQYKTIPNGRFDNVGFKTSIERVIFGYQYVNGYKAQWTYSKMPAYKEEPYSTGSADYCTGLNFELSNIDFPGYYFKEISPTYSNLSEKMLEEQDFGAPLKSCYFLDNKVKKLVAGCKNDTEKLKKIFNYISQNFVWNGEYDCWLSQSLRKTAAKEKGNSADLNMVLIGMLREADIGADPVILSTRGNGKLNHFFALLQKFNYVVAQVRVDGNVYLVDATDPLRPYNQLPFECLNDDGWRVVETGSDWVRLRNNESSTYSYLMNLNLSESGTFKGNINKTYSGYDAYNVRSNIKYLGKEGYQDLIKYSFGNGFFENFEWENLDSLEKPVKEQYDITINDAVQIFNNKIAFKPLLLSDNNINKFSSEERIAPVDFGCPQNGMRAFNIVIPEDYTVEELPQPVNIELPDNGGQYIFSATFDGKGILVQTRISVNSTYFAPEKYALLREFYARILKSQEEMIILKRKI